MRFSGVHTVLAELAARMCEIRSGDYSEPGDGPKGFAVGVLCHFGFLGLGLWAVQLGQDESCIHRCADWVALVHAESLEDGVDVLSL